MDRCELDPESRGHEWRLLVELGDVVFVLLSVCVRKGA